MLRRFVRVQMFLKPHLDIDVENNTETFQRYAGSTQYYVWTSTVKTVHEMIPPRTKPLSRGHRLHRIANAWLTFHDFEKFAEKQVVAAEE